ncbi:MAG: NAD(+)/NADH kinase [Candidatus Colwellbacteria bacterium]|nr:NAD(+)/NADH kinase [Candidatus Colwellbacteria bacterium]
MRVVVVGENQEAVTSLLKGVGIEIVETKPEFVISYGGDGTLVRSEHLFPGLTKIVLKNSAVCKKCSLLPNDEVLRRVARGEYKTEELFKLEAGFGDKKLVALNDIIVHNVDPRHAIRYELLVNDRSVAGEVIGDGVVVATPFGSTAYYRSITDSFFEVGIGVAFNNSTEPSDHLVLKEDSLIKVKIARGPAVVYADNWEDEIRLKTGDEVAIQKAAETAKIVTVD